MQKILGLISLLVFIQNSFGQNTIQGVVLDASNNEEIMGANILVEGMNIGTFTDENGRFSLQINKPFPVSLVISFISFQEKKLTVSSSKLLNIKLSASDNQLNQVVFRGQRITEKQAEEPLTIEALNLKAIQETPSDNFYDGLGNLKGVDLTAASMGFKVINTRGFNSTSPVRSLQIIDGVDNQSPGLNFSLGNFLGASELDVQKVEIVSGASSSFFGPGAFNGVINMTTKNPFAHKGLTTMIKGGERQLIEGSVRWADVIKDNEGLDVFAYKLNLYYMSAYDWEADNNDPINGSVVDANNPGGYDKVNTYGDEYSIDYSSYSIKDPERFLGRVYRTGYREKDLVDYNSYNGKANLGLYFRTKRKLKEKSPELILNSNFGTGTTVYQGDNRFSLRDILFFQHRAEYRKKGNFFFRLYATHENAGNSFDPYFTAQKLQNRSKINKSWFDDYSTFFKNATTESDYPKIEIISLNPFQTFFDTAKAIQWEIDNQDSIKIWHEKSANYANTKNASNISSDRDFLKPGSPEFDQAFNEIISKKNNEDEGGSRFFDKSALYHIHGEKIWKNTPFDELRIGGNGRLYKPNSEGTIFYDTANTQISNREFGLYAGFKKTFFHDRAILSGSLRTDKNQNFDFVYSPAASLVYKPTNKDFLRMSFSSGVRNPTLSDQFLFLDVGPAILSGNLNGVKDLITYESFIDHIEEINRPLDSLKRFNINSIKPEQVRTFEVGYRTTIDEKLFVDASYYFNSYTNFIGYKLGVKAKFDEVSGNPYQTKFYRYSANSSNQVTTQGFAIGLNYYFKKFYQLMGNYSWNKLIQSAKDDPIIPAFNTPEHKFNIGFSARDLVLNIGERKIKFIGFNINYKWIEGFLFEGSPQFTGQIPTYDLLNAQINYRVEKWHSTFKIGASNLLNNMQFQTYGGPRIGRLAYFSILSQINN